MRGGIYGEYCITEIVLLRCMEYRAEYGSDLRIRKSTRKARDACDGEEQSQSFAPKREKVTVPRERNENDEKVIARKKAQMILQIQEASDWRMGIQRR